MATPMAGIALEIGANAAFTIMSMIPEILGSMNKGDSTLVEFGVGLELDQSEDFSGMTPGIALFDTNGDRIGLQMGGDWVKSGASGKVTVNSIDKHDNRNPEYITVSQSPRVDRNNICINWMTVAAPSNSEPYKYGLAPGEMVALCNRDGHDYPWYFSNEQQTIKDKTVRPKCMMLDPAPGEYAGFSAHLIDFNTDNAIYDTFKKNLTQMCGSAARFKMYKSPMNEKQCPKIFDSGTTPGQMLPLPEKDACHPTMDQPDPFADKTLTEEQAKDLFREAGDEDPYPDGMAKCPKTRRLVGSGPYHPPPQNPQCPSKPNRRDDVVPPFDGHLIKSSYEGHLASELCRDPATRGPAFYSAYEHMLCDTSTHTLYYACSGTILTQCFDEKNNHIRTKEHLKKRSEGFGYHSIQHWH